MNPPYHFSSMNTPPETGKPTDPSQNKPMKRRISNIIPPISHLVRNHNNWRNQTINLLPSENILSPAVLEALGSDLSSRYSLEIHAVVHGEYVENAYRGTRFSEEIIHQTERLACNVFSSKYAVTDCLSGHIAGMNMVLSGMKKGELLMTTPIEYGGYDGYTRDYFPEMFGYRSGYLPFDESRWNLSDTAPDAIRKERPGMVVIGTSYILFPYDLKPLREACDDVGARLVFDASHVLGLIAGGEFQPDAVKMCDAVYGSTHKSFFGPQGGLILTNDEEYHEEMRKNLTWRTIDNPHLNRIAGLGIALEEMERWAGEYAAQVVKNSRTLGRELYERDVPVKYPPEFSASHQLHFEGERLRERFGLGLNEAGKKLEENHLIADAVGRLGTAEVTRIGMKEKDMQVVGALVKAALTGDSVGEEVKGFRKKFALKFI